MGEMKELNPHQLEHCYQIARRMHMMGLLAWLDKGCSDLGTLLSMHGNPVDAMLAFYHDLPTDNRELCIGSPYGYSRDTLIGIPITACELNDNILTVMGWSQICGCFRREEQVDDPRYIGEDHDLAVQMLMAISWYYIEMEDKRRKELDMEKKENMNARRLE